MEYWDDEDDGSWWVAPDPEPEANADEEEQGGEEQPNPNPKELKSILKSKSSLVKTLGALKGGGSNVKSKAQNANANTKAKKTLDCWNSTAIKNEETRKEREKMTEGQKPLAFNNVFKTKAMMLKNVNNLSDPSKKATNETNPWMKPTKKALENDHETLQQERERKKMEMEQVTLVFLSFNFQFLHIFGQLCHPLKV